MKDRRGRGRSGYTRREFCRAAGGAALALGALGCPALRRPASKINKVIVLGVDGMDPGLLMEYVEQGSMPNCRRLIETGAFSPLCTSDPPQSPVAWSNFISGTNPGGHGVFDFIAREAATLKPHLATARTLPPGCQLRLGGYVIPLSGARPELLRQGPTLWKILDEAGVASTVLRAPVNFPPTSSGARTLSGLTTPDIHGSYGIFSLFTSDPGRAPGDVSGGHIERVGLRDGVAECVLPGPANSFRKDGESSDVPFRVELDAGRRMAVITIQSARILLREGEWSDWLTVSFPLMPLLAEVSGVCRFYLKQAQPHLELYVSPVNIDPAEPAMPISTPAGYARELAEEVGCFYTQGMAEDTSALAAGVFSDDEFREQATFVLEESLRLFAHELDRFENGFLFSYFSSLDLDSHAFWRCVDPGHPLFSRALARRHGDYLPWLYARIDEAIGRALERVDERTLLFALSDHGFVSFRRQFNLNSWLMDHGYARARNALDRESASFFGNTDWRGTKAYGLGINSLYLNVEGREPQGTVAPGEPAERLRTELIERLTAIRDPQTGDQVISRVCRPEEIYSGPCVDLAPDLLVCYNVNYRASWDTILGGYPREHLLDNTNPWSGDHCMDSQFLPGVLLCNRALSGDDPALYDLPVTILKAFDIEAQPGMTGRNLLGRGGEET